MSYISHFIDAQELQRLGRYILQSRYVVEGNLSGRHRSPMKGASSEFADHRAYQPGDDPKRLDWKVLGRTDRYYVRRYEDETNLRVYFVVDRSASMGYTSGDLTKYMYACRLTAALGYVVVKARDSIGLYLYSQKMDARTGARNSFSHLNNVLRILQEHKPGSTTSTAQALHQVAEDIRRRALVIVISDLLDDPDDIFLALSHFRRDHHDVILFHTLDAQELDFTFPKGAEFEDLETGERLVVDPRAVAPAYREAMRTFIQKYQDQCAQLKIDYRLVRTNEPVDTFVRAYLEDRKRASR